MQGRVLSVSFILLFFVIYGKTFACDHCKSLEFVENKTQWQLGVLFKADFTNGSIYLENKSITFNWLNIDQLMSRHLHEPSKPISNTIDAFAYRMNFLNAQKAKIIKNHPTDGTFNYFIGNDKSKWAGGCRAYEEVIYQEIYKQIDLKVYSNNAFLKYDFILKPGADIELIQVKYEGLQKIQLEDGNLGLQTSLGKIIELKPYAYQLINGVKQEVSCEFVLKNDVISYAVKNYDKSKELVIDPTIIFSTYSGSYADNFGYTATYDDDGNLYAGSSAFGSGYPVTLGAYQLTWAGGSGAGSLVGTDIAITKYTPNGSARIFSTYLGGYSDELPHSLIVNAANELYILGTSSSPNFPVTSGAFDTTFGGGSRAVMNGLGVDYFNGSDIIISKLSIDGTALNASTFLGGRANDGLNLSYGSIKYNYADEIRGEIILDKYENVVIASNTFSDNYPTTAGAYQTSFKGNVDGCITKLDPNLSTIIWSTFVGTRDNEAIYSIEADLKDNFYFVGGTTSDSFPTTPGAYRTNPGGGRSDGFIALIDSNGSRLIHSTYFCAKQYDQLYFVQTDRNDDVFVLGQTEAVADSFIINAAYGTPSSGQFIAKFTTELDSVIWSTAFGTGGGKPNISPTAFLVDLCNKVYVAGWGGAVNVGYVGVGDYTTGMPVTADAYQSTTDGSDFYLFVLEDDASAISYGSFFGGAMSAEHVDGGTSRFDRKGVIYESVCAGCGRHQDFPIYPRDSVVSNTNNSGNCNNGLFKFDFNLPIVIADFDVSPVICVNDTFDLTNRSKNSDLAEIHWDFGDGTTSSDSNPSHYYSTPGVYTIKLSIVDPGTCNSADSTFKTVRILNNSVDSLETKVICFPDRVRLGFPSAADSGLTYNWYPPDGVFTPNASLTYAYVDSSTSFYLVIDNGACQDTFYQNVLVFSADVIAPSDTLVCEDDTVRLIAGMANTYPEVNYTWTPSTYAVGGDTNNAVLTLVPSSSEFYIVFITTPEGCIDAYAAQVLVLNASVSGDTLPVKYICDVGDSAEIGLNLALDSSFHYHWSPDSLVSSADSFFTYAHPINDTWFKLEASNGICSGTFYQEIKIVSQNLYLDYDSLFCPGDFFFITADSYPESHNNSFQWTATGALIDGQGTDKIVVADTQAGNAVLYYYDSTLNCALTKSLDYEAYYDLPELNVWADRDSFVLGESVDLFSESTHLVSNYQWQPLSGLDNANIANPIATPDNSIIYYLTITDENGCKATDSLILYRRVLSCGKSVLFIPNAFTPNNDGQNDVFKPQGRNLQEFYMAVYDRWGQMVFETNDASIGWDGTFKGKKLDPSVFAYYAEFVCENGEKLFEKGNVSLLK